MATLKRCHAPVPWGAQVEQTVWERSKRGTPRRSRSDRPPLRHDPGWDWDGRRILLSETPPLPEEEAREREVCAVELWEDDGSPTTHTTLSLLDIAHHQATKRRRKGRSGLDDFEIIRVPKVVPILDERPDIGESWMLGEWERLDALGFKRTYCEVARGFVDAQDPPSLSGCSRVARSTDDDPWECL